MSEFRAATTESTKATAPAPEAKNPARAVTLDEEVPVALYEEIKGFPYTAEYFEVLEIWDDSDILMKDDILDIESAYRNKVTNGELADGEKTFKDFVKEAEKVTGTKNSPPHVKIAKIAEWVKFMNKLSEIDKNRRKYGR